MMLIKNAFSYVEELFLRYKDPAEQQYSILPDEVPRKNTTERKLHCQRPFIGPDVAV